MRPFPVARAGNGLGMDEERDRGDELLEEQEHRGYGEDEGEREAGFEREEEEELEEPAPGAP